MKGDQKIKKKTECRKRGIERGIGHTPPLPHTPHTKKGVDINNKNINKMDWWEEERERERKKIYERDAENLSWKKGFQNEFWC